MKAAQDRNLNLLKAIKISSYYHSLLVSSNKTLDVHQVFRSAVSVNSLKNLQGVQMDSDSGSRDPVIAL